jgi:hypothetical protein
MSSQMLIPIRRSPSFVEHVVGGQERLAEPLVHSPAAQEHGAVEQRTALGGWIGFGKPDEHGGQIGRLARERCKRIPAGANECRVEQQIAGQIPDECELGGHGQVRAPRPRVAQRVGDQPRVAREIANRRVDLQ